MNKDMVHNKEDGLVKNNMPKNFVLSCEHATNFIPEKYRDIFDPERYVKGKLAEGKLKDIMQQHFAYDIGVIDLAEFISKKTKAPLRAFPVSRLLIEGNRYLKKSFFSKLTRDLPEKRREDLINNYWAPHIESIRKDIKKAIGESKWALHLGFHSFTPELKGERRNCDIGVLFDPKYDFEKKLSHKLQKELQKQFPKFVIRRNYPYPGYSQGLTRYFHKYFPEKEYVGIELEINNKHLLKDSKGKDELFSGILSAIEGL